MEKAVCMLCKRWKGTFKTYLSSFFFAWNRQFYTLYDGT